MAAGPQAGAVPGRRGVFDVDADQVIPELELMWAVPEQDERARIAHAC